MSDILIEMQACVDSDPDALGDKHVYADQVLVALAVELMRYVPTDTFYEALAVIDAYKHVPKYYDYPHP